MDGFCTKPKRRSHFKFKKVPAGTASSVLISTLSIMWDDISLRIDAQWPLIHKDIHTHKGICKTESKAPWGTCSVCKKMKNMGDHWPAVKKQCWGGIVQPWCKALMLSGIKEPFSGWWGTGCLITLLTWIEYIHGDLNFTATLSREDWLYVDESEMETNLKGYHILFCIEYWESNELDSFSYSHTMNQVTWKKHMSQ